MRATRFAQISGLLILSCIMVPAAAPGPIRGQPRPPDATRCEVSLPIRIELSPLNAPALARPTRFGVHVESSLDPDLVQSLQLLYELPPRVRMVAQAGASSPALRKSGRTELELGIMLPDRELYPIRARLVAHLANGRTISQTAVRWVGLSGADHPAAMIGRLVDPDGTGIRIYQGETVKEPR